LFFRILVMVFALLLTFTASSFATERADNAIQQSSAAQKEELARGISLYEQGDYKGAIESLRAVLKERDKNSEAWHYLGLALIRVGDIEKARTAFEREVKLRPRFVAAHVNLAYTLFVLGKPLDAEREAKYAVTIEPQRFDADAYFIYEAIQLHRIRGAYEQVLKEAEAALQLKPDSASALLLKSLALVGLTASAPQITPQLSHTQPISKEQQAINYPVAQSRFKEAAVCLERYLRLKPDDKDANYLRERLEAIKIYVQDNHTAGGAQVIYKTSEVTTKARILSKPEPSFTTEARKAQVDGIVLLRVVLDADGTIKHILVIVPLGYGLTEKALQAARKIRFEPAIKDGQKVSTMTLIEFNFNIY